MGLTAVGVDKLPEVKTHELAVPRIAIVHTWTNTQNEGWYRIEFDRLQIPYSYISDHVIRNTPNLREKFDVMIFPPVGGSAQTIVNGMPQRGEPIPWKASDLTPNFAQSPDQTDDMRGGMGVDRRREPAEVYRRGRFVHHDRQRLADPDRLRHHDRRFDSSRPTSFRRAARSTTRRFPIARVRSLMVTTPVCRFISTRRRCFRLRLPVEAVLAAAVAVAVAGWRWRGIACFGTRQRQRSRRDSGDAATASGRSCKRPDPDEVTAEQRESPFFTPPQLRPRVVLRFASDEKKLLISGMLAGGNELANGRRWLMCRLDAATS